MKILIAEDDVNSRVLLERALLRQGYAVESAGNGIQALEKTNLSPPDLIISDILMPEMDGFELCRRVKTDERLHSIPFVFYTATYTDKKDEDLALSLGASRFLIKPMEPEAFLSAISGVIEEHKARTLPVTDHPMVEMAELDRLQIEALARKLDKKVRELEEERRELRKILTERKQAEEALNASEEKYRLVVENANDAIFIVQDEMLKFPNQQLSLITKYTAEELIGIPFHTFIHHEDRDMAMGMYRKRLSGEDVPSVYSFRIINKTGETIWVEISAVFLMWEGRPATLNFLRDITFQKKLEEQLIQSQKMEAVGHLAGGVAHDFNNLLTVIIGYGHLLKNEAGKDDHLHTYAAQILSAAERAAILTNDLLTFSRKQIINLHPANLNEIIKNIESLLLRVIGEDVELSLVLTDADLTIMADSTQIDQILMNLATNAQDAMPKGGSFIIRTDRMEINSEFIKAHGYGKPGPYALLSVEDTGTGMDEKIRERIFEPFFTTKEVGKGTGLGLSMTYGIVKQHDGYISVYTEPDRGTAFKILLPLIQTKIELLKSDDTVKAKGGNETILIGEDDAQVRSLLSEVLSKAGYRLIEAVDGENAAEVFRRNMDDIQLLILDVIMPKKNGRELYEEIKRIRSDIKVLFLSGYSADIIHTKGILEVGMNFISKPVSPDKLLLKVRDVLDN